mmetsp:Transcript_16282/g.48818  ORF Transcript_16282/g.48818 Transcript_16282/m.48818 type:complete len:275 (-) Transcript_16282:414-1238(-)
MMEASNSSQSLQPYESSSRNSCCSSAAVWLSSPSRVVRSATSDRATTSNTAAMACSLMPSSSNSNVTFSWPILSSLSTMTHTGPNDSSWTPLLCSTCCSTLRLLILMPTSWGPRPTALKKVIMAASISASASTPATPMMSRFHCQWTRLLPRVARSYRQHCPIWDHLAGSERPLPFCNTRRANVGVSSGRSATRLPPLSSKLYSCPTISSPAFRTNRSSASKTGPSTISKPNCSLTRVQWSKIQARARMSSGRKSFVPGSDVRLIFCWPAGATG